MASELYQHQVKNRLDLWDLPELLRLGKHSDYDSLEEANADTIWESAVSATQEWEKEHPRASEARKERYQERAHQKMREALYGAWRDAVVAAFEAACTDHGLDVTVLRTRVRVSPARGETWRTVADKLVDTINGVGLFEFQDAREMASSVPASMRGAVLAHLGCMKDRPEVYGDKSYRRIYESDLESNLRRVF